MAFRFHWLVGELALAEGDGEQAARAYRAALTDRLAVGDLVGVAISVLGLERRSSSRPRQVAERIL
jgi:hypothetical protein